MNKKAIIIAVVVFTLIVLGMFIFAYLKSTEVEAPAPLPTPTPREESPEVKRIDAKHFYRNGAHTLVGEINMPTPCDLLTTSAAVIGDIPARAVVNFDVINNADVCAQVITPQRFKVSFTAGADVVIEGFFKGEPALLNLIEGGEEENPDDFELFIKG